MYRRLAWASFFIFSFIIPPTYFISHFYRFLRTPLNPTRVITLVFEPGSSVHHLLALLQQQTDVNYPRFFLLLAYLKGATNKLKSGEYRFASGTKPGALIDQMLNGRVFLHHFTLVEGWTFQQLITSLNASPYLEHEIDQVFPREQLSERIGLVKSNPEGLFFPATYYFRLSTKDSDLLKWAYALLCKKLNNAWRCRAPHLPYRNSYEALIVASLIERETALDKERPMISGVIVRRLKHGIPLQIDSSVIYGLGALYKAKLSLEDLHKDTPYNTYTRRGLPPTPIGSASLLSIEAALHPDHSTNLYFVAKGDGSHQFSSVLSEHNSAVRMYQLEDHYLFLKRKKREPQCYRPGYMSSLMEKIICP